MPFYYTSSLILLKFIQDILSKGLPLLLSLRLKKKSPAVNLPFKSLTTGNRNSKIKYSKEYWTKIKYQIPFLTYFHSFH